MAKRIVALMLAAVLLLTAFAALAEDEDVTQI